MLLNEEDEIIKEQDKILEEELRYYRLLYTQPVSPRDHNRDEVKKAGQHVKNKSRKPDRRTRRRRNDPDHLGLHQEQTDPALSGR